MFRENQNDIILIIRRIITSCKATSYNFGTGYIRCGLKRWDDIASDFSRAFECVLIAFVIKQRIVEDLEKGIGYIIRMVVLERLLQ